ncbi:DUF3408 domain-containing protein [Hymenobacter sp. BT491]|uniref:DUF3408 domain-containing protein n=1 Tax=Hymenobacter sp. BT491 TaxID=2766779 RepID=UPI001653AC09|nr:DUF3408 domain-containing protein [Hymenobacter sp. BT491]MBC6992507.1 DUF3408 domain-containing protein [Hymenobacter sp. BT491]
MAASKHAPDVTAFVSTFARHRPPAAPETTTEADSCPEPSPAMQAVPTSAAATETTRTVPTLTVERGEETVQKGRKEPAPDEQPGRVDYAVTFLHRGRERKNKAIYITDDAHRTLSAIIQASDGTPLTDLLANIITHHFETFGPDIRAFLTEQEKKNKKRLLI